MPVRDIGISFPQRNIDKDYHTPQIGDLYRCGNTRILFTANIGHAHWPPPFPDLPLGCPEDIVLVAGETAEQRAFRRFPINSHKPGPR